MGNVTAIATITGCNALVLQPFRDRVPFYAVFCLVGGSQVLGLKDGRLELRRIVSTSSRPVYFMTLHASISTQSRFRVYVTRDL